jgi:hypothetical protein
MSLQGGHGFPKETIYPPSYPIGLTHIYNHTFGLNHVNYYSLCFKLVVTTLVKFALDTHISKHVSVCMFAYFRKKLQQ